MPNTKIDVPALHGGISQQPPNLRHFHQVEDATNAVFTLDAGLSKRAGTRLRRFIEGLDAQTTYRMHTIDRDGSEQYVVIYGGGDIHVLDAGTGEPVPVTIDSDAATYLAAESASATELRLATVADFTFVLNTLVAVDTLASAGFEIDEDHVDYDTMLSWTPDLDTYHFTRDGDAFYPAGWWQYTPADEEDATFCTIEGNEASSSQSATSYYSGEVSEFKIHFTNPDTASDEEYTCRVDFNEYAIASMHDVARALQDAIQAAGATDALVGWRYTSGDQGRMYFTSPYRGEDATAPSTMFEDVSGLSFTGAGGVMNVSSATVHDGTGDPATSTLKPYKRWLRVAGPDQDDVQPDPATMPVQMRRTLAPHYSSDVLADEPDAYARLGDGSGSDVTNEVGDDGEYFNSPTLGADGLLTGDSDTAVTFDGVDQYARLPQTIGDPGTHDGIRVEVLFKTTSSTGTIVVCNNGSADQRFQLRLNSGKLVFIYTGTGNSGPILTSDDSYDDGEIHHVIAQYNMSTDTAELYVDGELIESGTVSSGGSADFDHDIIIAATINGDPDLGSPGDFFEGTIDEVAVYTTLATEDDVERRHLLATTDRGFVVEPVTWEPRLSGDDDTNPAPSLFRNNSRLADISFHRNRLVIAGDENVVMSQSGDFFNFYIDDAENVADADPIDVALSTDEVTLVDFVQPFRNTLVIFTKAGRQFELSAPEALTASTASITPTTAYPTVPIRPVSMGHHLYFAAQQTQKGQVYEYFYDDIAASLTASEVTAHVPRLLPADIRRIAGSITHNTLALLPDDADAPGDVYLYRFFWRQNEKVQSAWARLRFDVDVLDIGVIRGELYLLTRDDDGDHRLEVMNLAHDYQLDGFAWPVHLDRIVTADGGTYNAGNDETTFDQGVVDESLDTVVTKDGDVLDAERVDATTVAVEGDHSGDDVAIGKAFEMTAELSRPWVRGRQGNAIITGTLHLHRIDAVITRTGHLVIRSAAPLRDDRLSTFTFADPETTRVVAYVNGDAERQTLTIESSGPRPCTVTALEYAARLTTRTR